MKINSLNFYFIIVLFAIFLQACQQTSIVAQAPDEKTAQKFADAQKCERIICEQNQQCREGNCICKSQFKECNNKCMPEESCCTADDCNDGQYCNEQNICRKVKKQCSYLEKWDSQAESCACIESAKFCESQNKCIPKNNCCTVSDCTFRRDICQETKYAARICIKDETMHCRTIAEKQNDLFLLKNNTYVRIHVNSVIEDGNTNVVIDKNTSKLLALNVTQPLTDNSMMYAEEIKHSGGICKMYSEE